MYINFKCVHDLLSEVRTKAGRLITNSLQCMQSLNIQIDNKRINFGIKVVKNKS
jgi:hypothetical protein